MKFINTKVLSLTLFVTTSLMICCKKEVTNENISINSSEKIIADSSKQYKEPFRPQFHFSPEKKFFLAVIGC